MKAIIFRILLLSFFPLLSFSQNESNGLFIELKEKPCIYKNVNLLNTKKNICISENPIITVKDYTEISQIEIDKKNKIREFQIKLSEKGNEKLEALNTLYKGNNLAFVVDNEVVCLMKVRGLINVGKIIVYEDVNQSSIQKVHNSIMESFELKPKE